MLSKVPVGNAANFTDVAFSRDGNHSHDNHQDFA